MAALYHFYNDAWTAYIWHTGDPSPGIPISNGQWVVQDITGNKIAVDPTVFAKNYEPSGTLVIDKNDTTPDYLANKIVAGSNASISILNSGADEQIQINASTQPGNNLVKADSTDTTPGTLIQKLEAGTGITISLDPLTGGSNDLVKISSTGGGANLPIWFRSDSSDISGYYTLLTIPGIGSESTNAIAVQSSSSPQSGYSFASITGGQGMTTLAAGLWTFNTYLSVSALTGVTTFTFSVYNRTSGGVETLLFSVTTAPVTSTSASLYQTLYTQNTDISVNPSDRLVIKVSVNTTSISLVTAVLYYEGSTHASSLLVPYSLQGSKVSVDGNDTTPNYLANKLTAGTNITSLSVQNSGSNETLQINASTQTGDHKVLAESSDTTPDYLGNKIVSSNTSLLSITDNPSGANNDKVQLSPSGKVFVNSTDTTPDFLSTGSGTGKIIYGSGISISVTNPSANAQVVIAATGSSSYSGRQSKFFSPGEFWTHVTTPVNPISYGSSGNTYGGFIHAHDTGSGTIYTTLWSPPDNIDYTAQVKFRIYGQDYVGYSANYSFGCRISTYKTGQSPTFSFGSLTAFTFTGGGSSYPYFVTAAQNITPVAQSGSPAAGDAWYIELYFQQYSGGPQDTLIQGLKIDYGTT